MTSVEIARDIVLATSTWPGVKVVYQELYELGLSFTARALRSLPDVLVVMVRVGEDGRVWVPGLSDYDLTVLTERFDAARMVRVLDELWRRYRRLKNVVPQLGEMEVMNVEEYGDSLSFGPMSTASLKRAEPLFVRPGHPAVARALRQRARTSGEREFLVDALSRYVRFFVPAWLQHASAPSNRTRRRAEHLLENVFKRLRHLGVPPPTHAESLDERTRHLFGELSRACTRMPSGQTTAAAVGYVGDDGPVSGAIPAIEAFAAAALQHAAVRDCSVVLWISYMSVDKLNLAFVVPDDTSSRELLDLFAALGRLHRSSESLWRTRFSNGELQPYFPSFAYPVVVSRSMWTCWREVSPFDGAAIATSGRTLIGPDDGLREMPSIAALQRGAEVQYAALLSLKNNWRTLDVAGATRLYAAMVNHVRGVLWAASGTALAVPTMLRFASAEDGYRAVSEQLDLLRARLERIASGC